MKILATGVFDILHTGHLDYLEYAKSLGDFLIVHVESDEAVRRHKGKGRPVNSENDRLRLINNLKIVDQVFVDDGEKNYQSILKKYRPNVFVIAPKKSFNKSEKEIEYKKVLPNLKVVWFAKKPRDNSTTKILDQITKEL